jgi:hypothetical protein
MTAADPVPVPQPPGERIRPTLGYSGLTGTVYVLFRNGQKRPVPEAEVVAVIAGYLDDHDLMVTKDDGTKVRYLAAPEVLSQ